MSRKPTNTHVPLVMPTSGMIDHKGTFQLVRLTILMLLCHSAVEGGIVRRPRGTMKASNRVVGFTHG
jgi:hypothetical protein